MIDVPREPQTVALPEPQAFQEELSPIGRFELPNSTSDNPSYGSPSSSRAGASADPSPLEMTPMIVWLRGDEPWFSEFDMDADAVMNVLNIKRSRLTQISGRDLRVGRVRMDRYVRPVYRRTDVDEYLKWTRATASHQKSSDAIKTAVEQLNDQSTKIESQVKVAVEAAVKSGMEPFKNEAIQQVQRAQNEISHGLQAEITPILTTSLNDMRNFIEFSTQQIRQTLDSAVTDTLKQYASQQMAALEVLTLQMNQMSEKTAVMEERLTAWDKMLMENLERLDVDLKNLKSQESASIFTKARKKKRPRVNLTTSHETRPLTKLSWRAAPLRRKPKS